MSTAAPAAPSTSAPAAPAQPSPVSAPQPGQSGTPQTDAADSIPAAPRKALRPIPNLPGVIPDADFSSFGAPSDAGTSPGTGPARDAQGRFLPGSAPGQDGAEDHTLEATPPTKYRFAGEEFESAEAAEQNFKSLRGQFKPLTQLAKSLGGIDKIPATLTRAAESARGWEARAKHLQAELDSYRQGSQPAQQQHDAPDTTHGEPAEAEAGVDWALYAEIQKLAHESGEPWKAEQWLINETQKAERARYEQLLEDRLAPYDQERQRAGVVTQTEALFGQLAEYAYPDGSPAFPELHDESAAYEIGRLWVSLGLPREAAMTPSGAAAAVALYRMQRAGRPLTVPAQPAAPTAVDPRAPAAPTDAAAAAALADGRTSQFELPGQGGPSAEAARILAGLRSTNAGNRSVLGFDA